MVNTSQNNKTIEKTRDLPAQSTVPMEALQAEKQESFLFDKKAASPEILKSTKNRNRKEKPRDMKNKFTESSQFCRQLALSTINRVASLPPSSPCAR